MSRRRNRRERQLANQIAAQIRSDFQRIEGRIRGTALGVGWLYRPQPPLQRRDIRVSGDTRHAIRAGGNIEVRLGGSAGISANASAEVVPADSSGAAPSLITRRYVNRR